MASVNPYSVLAECYDDVMAHVDYDEWAWFVQQLCDHHDHAPGNVLELGCGTGIFASLFTLLDGVTSYRAVDASPDMIAVALKKNARVDADFAVQSFAELKSDPPGSRGYDTVLLLYDGLNYLMESEAIDELLARVSTVLRPGGLFIFDQSTPANSLNNESFFEDSGFSGPIRFIRKSSYDPETAIHTTEFELAKNGVVYKEKHLQRCYSGPQIQVIIEPSPLKIEGGYSGFSLEPADTESERIHWVVRKP
jgi:SAM-dependent methyltransferase